MSGTQDFNLAAKNSIEQSQGQTGADKILNSSAQEVEAEEQEKELTSSQKMDALIRGSSAGFLKREVERLRKEAAKFRTSTKEEEEQKLKFQAQAEEMQKELETLRVSHRNLAIIQKLDKAGCIKSNLVAKDIPMDMSIDEDLDEFIEAYKEENKFLFKEPKKNAGGVFKASGAKNLTPSQQMDAYIRAALGR